MKEKFLYINEADVISCLAPGEVIDAVEYLWKHWRDGAVLEGEHTFLPAGPDSGNEFLHMPVCLPETGILGFKWVSCYMNPAPGYPFSHGNLIVLNDMATGSLMAVVSASRITAMRTAGGHGVAAARYLAGKNVKRLAVIGSGIQAIQGIHGFLHAFPQLKEIRMFCRKRESFDRIRAMFTERVAMEYTEDIRNIGRGADVILTATSSSEILLRQELVEQGTTVIALDGFVDTDPLLASRADKWYVGNRKTDVAEIIDSGVMSQGMVLKPEDIYGELPDVVGGNLPGREHEDEIIVYTHMGAGAYDIACAYEVYKKALALNKGTELEL